MSEIPYTDPEGTVHIWIMSTGKTRCGADTAMRGEARPVVACEECVRVSIQQFADEHAQRMTMRPGIRPI